MSHTKAAISVVVPVYNVEDYVKRCLDSLVMQTMTAIEVLVVDDGSTDGSGAICDEYAVRYDTIQVLHKPNGGLSDARNYGLARATGEYVLFVDSDDYVAEDMMEKIVDLLLEKGFFHKETYEKHGILTSEQIQRVWFEATTRRKIDFSQLPYLLETKKKKGMQKEELNAENADIFETQEEVSQENADISRQTKLKETKLNSEEEEINDASIEIPGYAYNLATHNIAGLMESLDNHKVTDPKEKQTILRLSDYGRKGTQVWKLLSNTAWSKIGAPGKYIIAALASGRK